MRDRHVQPNRLGLSKLAEENLCGGLYLQIVTWYHHLQSVFDTVLQRSAHDFQHPCCRCSEKGGMFCMWQLYQVAGQHFNDIKLYICKDYYDIQIILFNACFCPKISFSGLLHKQC